MDEWLSLTGELFKKGKAKKNAKEGQKRKEKGREGRGRTAAGDEFLSSFNV